MILDRNSPDRARAGGGVEERVGLPLRTETSYDGPVTVMDLDFSGRAVRLVRPTEPDRMLDEPGAIARNAADDYMPYWAYLWPGSRMLAEAVAAEDWPEGTDALEIGCGLGLAGLVGLAAGLRHVRFTDYDAAPLRFVERSLAASGFDPSRASTGLLDWRDPPDERYPLILGADVLYERRLVPLVVGLLDRMLAPGGVALIAGPYRVATEDFPASLRSSGLTILDVRPAETIDEAGRPARGQIHRVGRSR